MDIRNLINATNSVLSESEHFPQFVSSAEAPIGTDSKTQSDILKRLIAEFEESLDPNHEVGIALAGFGQNILLNVTHVSFKNPSLMIFKGFFNDNPVTLIQHVSQLNFLLTSVPKEPDRPKRKIGFSTD